MNNANQPAHWGPLRDCTPQTLLRFVSSSSICVCRSAGSPPAARELGPGAAPPPVREAAAVVPAPPGQVGRDGRSRAEGGARGRGPPVLQLVSAAQGGGR